MNTETHTDEAIEQAKCEGDECPLAGYTKKLYPFLDVTFEFDAPVSEAVVKTDSKLTHEWAEPEECDEMKKLREENEQLKQEVDRLDSANDRFERILYGRFYPRYNLWVNWSFIRVS